MEQSKKSIVILGAGFAGLKTALLLKKKLKTDPKYQILLIDERDTHVYTPDLYEIATTYYRKITQECLTQLKDTVATPFSKIITDGGMQMLRDRVIKIYPASNEVELAKQGRVHFDYLVIALGAVANYYDIPGLTQFSYSLKTLTDSLAICCHLDTYFHTLWKKETKKHVSVVVGGGGATGVEFACELPGYLNKLCAKFGYPREHVSVTVVEGSANLANQGEKVTELILERFKKLWVNAMLESFIKEVKVNSVTIESKNSKQEIPMDILIWTGGVKPHPLISESFPAVSKNGALPVNAFLQHEKFSKIFAGGDNAFFIDSTNGKPAPMLAQIAVKQGEILAENIVADIEGKQKKQFRLRLKGVVIPLGGKYALLKKGNFVFKGFFIWMLQRLIDLAYLMSILPLGFAIRKWLHDTNVFTGND